MPQRHIQLDLSRTSSWRVEGKLVQVGFTYSGGMTHYVDGDSVASILRRTDGALREAQRRGKDRIVIRRPSFLRGLFHRSTDHRDQPVLVDR